MDEYGSPDTGSPGASSQRSRVTQACDPCREARRKCDSNLPSCCSCTLLRQECTYRHKPRKRGKPTGYIWALEVVIALLLDEDPANEEIIHQFVDSGAFDRDSSVSVYNEGLVRRLHAAWRDGETAKEINRVLGGDDPPPINYRPAARGGKDDARGGLESGAEVDLDELDGGCQWPLL